MNHYGSHTYQEVFKVHFNHPLSSRVTIECYDNNSTYPNTSNLTTTNNDVFGLSANEKSMIAMHENSVSGPAATNWFPTDYWSNNGSVNLMKGSTYYITQQSGTLSSAGGGSILFNIQLKIPASTQTSSSMGFDILVRYTFTSTTPTVSWYANAAVTQFTTRWAIVTPNTVGLLHTRAGTSSSGPFRANIPVTGQEKTAEGWITKGLA